MIARARTLIDLAIFFLDFLIHPKILHSSSFILLRARIIALWMLVSIPLIVSMYFHFHELLGPWHLLNLTWYYCFVEIVAVICALRVYGSYRVAAFILMFSVYLNTPVIIAYSGGLYSPNIPYLLFMPFGIFQLTKSLRLSFVGVLVGMAEVFFIFRLHRIGWDFVGNGIIENYHEQLPANLLVVTGTIWMISLTYSRGVTQVSLKVSDAKRFHSIMALSKQMVQEFEKPLTEIAVRCDQVQDQILTPEQSKKCLDEINETIFQMSSRITEFRLAAVEKQGER